MRDLPVKLPAPTYERRGGPWREAFFFIAAFVAVFVAAILAFDSLAGVIG